MWVSLLTTSVSETGSRGDANFGVCDFVNGSNVWRTARIIVHEFGSRAIRVSCIMRWILISIWIKKINILVSFVDLTRLRVFAINYSRCVVVFGRRKHSSNERTKAGIKMSWIKTHSWRYTSNSNSRTSKTNEEKTHERTMRNKAVLGSRWQWTLCEAYTFQYTNIHTFAIILHRYRVYPCIMPTTATANTCDPNRAMCACVGRPVGNSHSFSVYIPNVNLFLLFSSRSLFTSFAISRIKYI